ncbi:efflux RND transporter periplasmic adaptor subunit [Thiohalophilus sp.]|uniref:efflux RND transporter periplasmic adaptor subunit n=1 Tax=Thiohalophilus sp. TaxID=3028392 RepID=UPI002ACD603C|nr:efflux RND transporter periplasmic adaptor subunit [Thiohalophilus sp.]MDZ7804144.1 efflux RND transporter periplasmic adaptor subunit [Thiohalophilus sp.]
MTIRQTHLYILLMLGGLALPIGAPLAAEEDHAAEPAGEHERHVEEGAHKEADGEEKHKENAVHLSEAQHKRLNLKVEKAERGSAEAVVRLPATLDFDADRIARIGPRLRAKVVEVVKDLGAPVRAGEPVLIMDSVALGKAKAQYLTARARFNTEQANYNREQELAAQEISSEAALLEARARYRQARAELEAAAEELRLYGLSREAVKAIEAGGKTPLSRYVLTSPIDGVVQQRDVAPGQTVGPEATPIHVVDDSRMWVMIQAYERHIPALADGQQVHLRLRALPDETFEGRVDWISRALDRDSRTLDLRATVDNRDHLLRAGMFGTASIHVAEGGETALVPVDAVQRIEDKPMVFVPGDEPGAYRAVPVVLGEESGGQVEVIAGLHPGEALVVAGAFDLKSVMTAGGRSAAHNH